MPSFLIVGFVIGSVMVSEIKERWEQRRERNARAAVPTCSQTPVALESKPPTAGTKLMCNYVILSCLVEHLDKPTLRSMMTVQKGDLFNLCVRELYRDINYDVICGMEKDMGKEQKRGKDKGKGKETEKVNKESTVSFYCFIPQDDTC